MKTKKKRFLALLLIFTMSVFPINVLGNAMLSGTLEPKIVSDASVTFFNDTGGWHWLYNDGTQSITFTLEGTVPNGVSLRSDYGYYNGETTIIWHVVVEGNEAVPIGVHNFIVSATNATGSHAQNFTLNIIDGMERPFEIISYNSAAFYNDHGGFHSLWTDGAQSITFALGGTVPNGVTIESYQWSYNGESAILWWIQVENNEVVPIGTHNFSIIASNAINSYTQNFTLTIKDGMERPFEITSYNSATFYNNGGGSHWLWTDGAQPITFTLGGTVPNGVTIESEPWYYDGELSVHWRMYVEGNETVPIGTHNFTVTASNVGSSYTQNFTLVIRDGNERPPEIATPANATLFNDEGGSHWLSAVGAQPIIFTLDGAPSGVTVVSEPWDSGSESGIHWWIVAAGNGTVPLGTHAFNVVATNANGSYTQPFTLYIEAGAGRAPSITTTDNVAFFEDWGGWHSLQAVGTQPITFTLDGTIPNGVTIVNNTWSWQGNSFVDWWIQVDAYGATPGTYNFTIVATNYVDYYTQNFTLTILDGYERTEITTTELPYGVVGEPFHYQVGAINLPPNYRWVLDGILPPGLSFNTDTGVISGIPRIRGTSRNFWIDIFLGTSRIAEQYLSMTIRERLAAPIVTLSGATISWNAIANANGYRIYVDGVFKQAVGLVTSFNLAELGLAANLSHNITLVATSINPYFINSNPSGVVETPIPTRTVSITGGGTGSAITSGVSHQVGATVTVNAGTRSGYTFAGWTFTPSVSFAAGNNANQASTRFLMPNVNVTAMANWTAISTGDNNNNMPPPVGPGGGGGATPRPSLVPPQEPSQPEDDNDAEVTPPDDVLVPPEDDSDAEVTPSNDLTLPQVENRLIFTAGAIEFIHNDQLHKSLGTPFIDPATNRMMLPLRTLSEALGIEVDWCSDTRSALIFLPDGVLTLPVGAELPGGMGIPIILNHRMFVPLRYIMYAYDANVEWDSINRAANITWVY